MASDAICGAKYLEIKQPVVHCETCGVNRRMLFRMEAWRGGFWTCLSCGENYNPEEGRMERPFARGWRRRSVAEAKRFWREHGRKEFTIKDVDALRLS